MPQHYFQDRSATLPKRDRTRALLIDGAIATVAERGLAGASIKAITEAAGVSNGTFYNHFDDRDQLVRAAAAVIAEELTEEVAQEVADDRSGVARIVCSTDAFLRKAVEMPDWAALIVDASHHLGEVRRGIGRHLRRDVALAVRLGELDSTPTRFTLDQVGVLVSFGIRRQLERGKSKPIRRQTCEAVLRVLGVEPGRVREIVAASID